MVPTYASMINWGRYDRLLYMCPERNWSDGAQVMRSVEFDFIGRERSEATVPMAQEVESVPPKVSAWSHINEYSPGYDEDSENCTVREEIADTLRPYREECNPYFTDAMKRGWVCW